jgi:predicted lipoprotein with Yx(FWY)xxD motif
MNLRDHGSVLILALAAVAGCSDDTKSPPPSMTPDAPQTNNPTPDVTLSAAGTLGPHLVAKDGKTLYFYVPDVAGTNKSACTGGCLTAWPAFDAQTPAVGDGLTASDFGRFDRGGGVFQATFKGRPLYTYAADATGTTGEGVGGIWFVARAYNVFFGISSDTTTHVTPLGAAVDKPFLTNGAGKTLYVFARDTPPATPGDPPKSGCLAAGCYNLWPLWEKAATITTLVLPSTLMASDFTEFTNAGIDSNGPAKQQFVYKGYPLYFYTPDMDMAGNAKGAAVPRWYAVSAGFTPPVPAP